MKISEIKYFGNISEYVERYGFAAATQNADFYALRYEEIQELSSIYINSFRNSFFEISLDLSEGCSYSVDNFKCASGKNRITIVSPFRLQSIYSSETQSTEALKGYSLFFSAEFLEFNTENRNLINWLPFIGHTVSPVLQLNDDTVQEFINLFDRILFHHKHPNSESKNIIKHYVSILLLLLKNHSTNENIKSLSRESQIFAEFKQLLEGNFLAFTSVKQFAEKMHLSSKHFSETIKQISGKTPIQYIHEKKIDYAKSLLTQTNMSIKNIADELQFENESYFYTFFKRVSGATPAQFRNK